MTGAERGYLMLCCDLAEPDAKPLTLPQLRKLRQRMQQAKAPIEPDRDLMARDLVALGYNWEQAERIEALLSREKKLDEYLRLAEEYKVKIFTCATPGYPHQLLKQLGDDAPAVLFCRGDTSLLARRCVGLVGSRQISQHNRYFAEKIGMMVAQEGFVLVSGNAVGADQAAQDSCFATGGSVISFLPDDLIYHRPQRRQLLVAADSFHAQFTAARALQRNTLIHAMAEKIFVAQCDLGHGGTWAGTTENLRRKLSEVYLYNDHSPAMYELESRGAVLLASNFGSLYTLRPTQMCMF